MSTKKYGVTITIDGAWLNPEGTQQPYRRLTRAYYFDNKEELEEVARNGVDTLYADLEFMEEKGWEKL